MNIDMPISYEISRSLDGGLTHKLNRILRQELFRTKNEEIFKTLTKREVEILTLLASGLNNPEIAKHLFISRRTVEQHRKNINKKLNIKSFSMLFHFALAFDLI